jgi:DnaJ-class molecular chaperone
LKDYYTILGVARDSSIRQIKRAYKKLARQWHPDLHPQDPACRTRIREINEAYEVLGDPAKRLAYDRQVQEGRVVAGAWEHPSDSAFHSFFLKMNEVLRRKSGKP